MPKTTLLFNVKELTCQSQLIMLLTITHLIIYIFFLNNEEAGNVYLFFLIFMMKDD